MARQPFNARCCHFRNKEEGGGWGEEGVSRSGLTRARTLTGPTLTGPIEYRLDDGDAVLEEAAPQVGDHLDETGAEDQRWAG